MVVEDDPAIRSLTLIVLRHHGFRTLEAFDGQSGLATFLRHKNQVDLVLTDINIPPCGIQMAEKILHEKPSVKIGLMSGTVNHSDFPRKLKRFPILEKPFTAERLFPFVRKCLEREQTQF